MCSAALLSENQARYHDSATTGPNRAGPLGLGIPVYKTLSACCILNTKSCKVFEYTTSGEHIILNIYLYNQKIVLSACCILNKKSCKVLSIQQAESA